MVQLAPTSVGHAFRRTEAWDELVGQANGFPNTQAWLTGLPDVGTQVAVRHLLPAHYSTAALDAALGQVRDMLNSRSFVLRNKRRTNQTLGLILLHLNRQDVVILANLPCVVGDVPAGGLRRLGATRSSKAARV